jgi:hypothetical protein
MRVTFQPGDCVIYRKQKFSVHPGPHAWGVSPAPHGDSYSYCIDKCWRVVAVQPGQVVVCTRRGKQHTLSTDDPALRRARWWERLLLRHRFPPPRPAATASSRADT